MGKRKGIIRYEAYKFADGIPEGEQVRFELELSNALTKLTQRAEGAVLAATSGKSFTDARANGFAVGSIIALSAGSDGSNPELERCMETFFAEFYGDQDSAHQLFITQMLNNKKFISEKAQFYYETDMLPKSNRDIFPKNMVSHIIAVPYKQEHLKQGESTS